MSTQQSISLEQQLKSYIRAKGPISVRAFMEACLYDPQHGYYRAGNPIGQEGDFITAPEISQMFGEMIGVWSVLTWQAMGAPVPLQLIELGPGRGTLMADLLRTLGKIHPNFEMISVHLVDRSSSLRANQNSTLSSFDCPLHWYEKLSDVPSGPSLLIANEFLDCFPIRQFIKQAEAWHERVVALNQDGDFCFAVGESLPAGVIIPQKFSTAEPGSIFEFCPDFEGILKDIQRFSKTAPFAGLFIDYGFEGPQLGESLQALFRHKPVSPFTQPGEVDLTAHVDFTAFGALAVAQGHKVYGPRDQGAFLSQLGIGPRAEMLVQNASQDQADKLTSDVVRLVAPEQMGALFKVLCVTSPQIETPPPFNLKIETDDGGQKA